MTAAIPFQQKAADKLLRAAKRAGFEQVRLRIGLDGTIDFMAGPAIEAESPADNPLDRKLFDATQAPPAR